LGDHVVQLALGEVEVDERQHGEAEAGRADRRRVPGYDALALQPGQPGLHGTARDAEHPGVLAHAGLRLLEQEVQQIEVKLVQLHRSTAPKVAVLTTLTGPLAQLRFLILDQ
jgi:hypothetical protein